MKKNKMTLIEILGVIILIAILAAIGVGSYVYASNSSKEKATAASISRVENAFAKLADGKISNLRTTGDTTNGGFVTVKLDIAGKKLYFGNSVVGKNSEEQQKAFQIFTQALAGENLESITDSEGYLIDGWLQKFQIRYPGKFNKGNLDIISAGIDGVFGEDGSASSIPTDMAKYKDEAGDAICDDIANFL
jgi:type II secretory pathway pseudopilin PulG